MITEINNFEDYKKAMLRMIEIFDSFSGTHDSEEADNLAMLIDDYEKKNNPEFD